jgi:2-hydroxycyclohexanecarboxyl-CoA dehydrogenase
VADPSPSRVAVVTGGASGIGLAVSRQLAARGDRVAVLDIDAERAAEVAEQLRGDGATSLACRVDVADRATVDDAFAVIREELGPVHVLVTSAGITAFEEFTDTSLESWHRVLEVNLTGTFHCVQAAIPDMIAARWGRIVTIASSSAQRGSPRMAHYAASKGGVMALTRSLAREYAPYGITVNTIPPSGIETPMTQQSRAAGYLPSDEDMARTIPLGRLGTGDDVAAACVFLCSDGAGYITGQTVGVNGGSVL